VACCVAPFRAMPLRACNSTTHLTSPVSASPSLLRLSRPVLTTTCLSSPAPPIRSVAIPSAHRQSTPALLRRSLPCQALPILLCLASPYLSAAVHSCRSTHLLSNPGIACPAASNQLLAHFLASREHFRQLFELRILQLEPAQLIQRIRHHLRPKFPVTQHGHCCPIAA